MRTIAVLIASALTVGVARVTDATAVEPVDTSTAPSEFAIYTQSAPILTAYALALLAAKRCVISRPSEALRHAAGGDAAFQTELGKKVFIVMATAARVNYKSDADVARFCKIAAHLIATGEKYAANPVDE